MPVNVVLPAALREPGSNGTVIVDAITVRSALEGLGPQLSNRLLDDSGRMRRHVNVFVNRRNARTLDGLDTKLSDGDEVCIVPAVAGG